MEYSIKYRQISGLVDNDTKTTSLAAAKRIVIDAVNSSAAKHGEVRDATGAVVFEYPDPDFD